MEISRFYDTMDGFLCKATDIGRAVSNNRISFVDDVSSINDLKTVIKRLRGMKKKGVISPQAVRKASVCLGVLLGEMIVNEYGFRWIIRNGLPVVDTKQHVTISPVMTVYKLLMG